MTLSVQRLLEISAAVAHEFDPALRVLGVTAAEGSHDRAELLITVAGCHPGECLVMVNVGRGSADVFAGELRTAFRGALERHRNAAQGHLPINARPQAG
jgi:hypothetical protein